MRALRRGLAQDGDDVPALREELRTYLGPERRGQLVKAIPGQNSNVPITLLGSSDFSAQLAAALGLPFAFAAHFAPDALHAAANFYRERFQPINMLVQSKSLIDAAERNGVNHIVHLGAFATDHDSYATVFAWHQMIEAYLRNSGVAM